ncbi:hypothetical protein [Thalassoglobus polymorphus]|uniref:Uncharacterized protein n=1 Tax=Thalassoglobus polymorphus TaxID=2527994 RepID=A0A517QSY2_9PLAN|nr:hypothetical protein [Thalassoglobus polymorphus]QDT34733.1 hypothetical protein Mal48_40050 [Thalassoglobus polymorphus]
MYRFSSLAASCLVFALFLSVETQEVDAGGWCFSSSARYSSGYFHDYYNYGARYSHRPYGSYYGYRGVTPYTGYSYNYRSYYGGWSDYRPYAYQQSFYTNPISVQYVGYAPAYAGTGCSTCGTSGPVVTDSCSTCAPTACAPTCCSTTVAYQPGCFSHKTHKACGVRSCGLLGPLCPFKRHSCGFGTCGSYGYGRYYGW